MVQATKTRMRCYAIAATSKKLLRILEFWVKGSLRQSELKLLAGNTSANGIGSARSNVKNQSGEKESLWPMNYIRLSGSIAKLMASYSSSGQVPTINGLRFRLCSMTGASLS